MLRVLLAGDFAPRARLEKQIEEGVFESIFSNNLCSIIKSADFSFVNLECPVVLDGVNPIPKCGPNLRCSAKAIKAIAFASFTGVTISNNHILDYGRKGLNETLSCCDAHGLLYVGAGENLQQAKRILYLDKNGERIAIINCCEHEFSIASESGAGANPLDPVSQYYAIKEAKQKADYILVVVHGGHEFYQLPSPRMQNTYRFFVDAGADAVVNHHQHCYSGYEIYKGKPIFYGLGNFCFDIAPNLINAPWNYGYMVELQFGDTICFRLHPYEQYGEKPSVNLLEEHSFDEVIAELNDIISSKEKLAKHTEIYYQSCQTNEKLCLEPYSGRIMSKLFSMGLLPRFIKGNKALFVRNHIECEAHRDKLLYMLNNQNNE